MISDFFNKQKPTCSCNFRQNAQKSYGRNTEFYVSSALLSTAK